jgi:hypothetical protein
MTNFLPPLIWRPSANFSSRHGTRVDLIVLHDCEGGYEGSIRWFEMNQSNVSAHYVVREDGAEATQMVELADNAWHACAFNRRSVGVEMGGFASRGFGTSLLTTAARMFAYLCYHLQIPVRHARAGIGPGIASHNDLGVAGGGHHDPSSETDFMQRFVAMVERAICRTYGIRKGFRSHVFFRLIKARRHPPSSQNPCRSLTFIRLAGFNKRSRCSVIA